VKAIALVLVGVVGGVVGALVAGWISGDEEPSRTATALARGNGNSAASEEFRALERRLDDLESRLDARGGGAPRAAPADEESPGTGTTPREVDPASAPEERTAAPSEPIDSWLPALLAGKFEGEAVGKLFTRLTRDPKQIAGALERIQAAIADDPANAELRVALGTALVAKLQNDTPPGVQQGIVWGQADAAYAKAIELDPGHWTARYSRAFGTSFIPAQFGRRPDAIKQFEELISIQEQDAPKPEYAQSYFQLGRLYGESGNVEKAREIWRRGLALFPDDEQLKETLEVSSKR